MKRAWIATLLASALLLVPGCKSQCRQLSEKLCDCTATTSDKTTCLQLASQNEANYPPTASEEAYCRGLLEADKCDCRLTNSLQGKINCGLARPVPDAGQ